MKYLYKHICFISVLLLFGCVNEYTKDAQKQADLMCQILDKKINKPLTSNSDEKMAYCNSLKQLENTYRSINKKYSQVDQSLHQNFLSEVNTSLSNCKYLVKNQFDKISEFDSLNQILNLIEKKFSTENITKPMSNDSMIEYIKGIEIRILEIDKTVNKAHKQFTRFLNSISSYDSYSSAKIAKETATNAYWSIQDIKIPQNIRQDIRDTLQLALNDISSAYISKKSFYSDAMNYYNKQDYSLLDDMKAQSTLAEYYIFEGVLRFFVVESLLDIKSSPLRKRNPNLKSIKGG